MFNLVTIAISITKRKTEAIVSKLIRLLEKKHPKMRKLSSVTGSVISLFPAITFDKLHYRALEKDKTTALKKFTGYFDKQISQVSYK